MQPKKGLISYMDDEDDEGMDTSAKHVPVSSNEFMLVQRKSGRLAMLWDWMTCCSEVE